MMIFIKTFFESLKLPRKKSLFRLNRLGMDVVVFYMFILLGLVSMPSFIQQWLNPTDFISELNFLFYFIYFFIFHYLPLTIIILTFISLIAYIGTWIATMAKRKLVFSVLWKIYAFSTTLPFTIFIIFSYFIEFHRSLIIVAFLYTFVIFLQAIFTFPKIRPSTVKHPSSS